MRTDTILPILQHVHYARREIMFQALQHVPLVQMPWQTVRNVQMLQIVHYAQVIIILPIHQPAHYARREIMLQTLQHVLHVQVPWQIVLNVQMLQHVQVAQMVIF